MNLSIPEVLLAIFIYDVFKEGILKKIQVLIAAKLVSKSNDKIQELKSYADQTCTKIDNLFVNPLSGISNLLDGVINGADIPPDDQQLFRQLIDERYHVSLLAKKLRVTNEE
jgi:hypothetical protein